MIRSFFLTTLIALVLSFATSAPAQIKLTAKYPDGRKTTVVQVAKSAQTLTLLGMEVVSGGEQTISATSVNQKRGDDGKLIVKAKINAIEATIRLPGGVELEFDSSDPDADPPGTQFDFVLEVFKATAKSTWTMTLNQDNRVVAIEGRDAAFKDLPQTLKDSMKAQFDPEYLKTAANDEFDRLPSTPVSSGDKWERTNLIRLDSGQKFTFTTEYTYKGSTKKDGKKLEEIVFTVTEVEYDADADSILKVVESDLKVAKSTGLILFDNAAGQVVSTRSKLQIKGSLKLEVNGMELPGELDLTMENNTDVTIQ